MTKRDELIALADAYEAGTEKCVASGYEEFGPAFQRERGLVVTALRRLASSESSGAEPVAWIAFASTGLIRFWTSDRERADREKASGLDLRAFTLAELVSLAAKPAPPADAGMREALDAEERYLLEHFGSDADIMPGDIEGAFHRLRETLTAPGATTKSDGGLVPATGPVQTGDVLRYEVDEVSRVGEVIEHLRPSDPSSTRSEVTASLEGDAVERVAGLLRKFHRDSCYPEAMAGELNAAVNAVLATGLVAGEAAIRADEREKCAKVAEHFRPDVGIGLICNVLARPSDIAAAIRLGDAA